MVSKRKRKVELFSFLLIFNKPSKFPKSSASITPLDSGKAKSFRDNYGILSSRNFWGIIRVYGEVGGL
jgi:hypothetical protein